MTLKKQNYIDMRTFNGKRKPIKLISPLGFEKVFQSVVEVSEFLDLPSANICHYLSGRRKNIDGWKFEYAE